MSIKRAVYEIETQQGLAVLINKTVGSTGYPILFVHGFGSNAEIWFKFPDSIGWFFKKLNRYNLWTLELSNAISGNIEYLAHEDLLAAVHFIYSESKKKIRIISHSMGGIITRYLLSCNIKHPYPLKKVESMIEGVTLLSVPNHGVKPPHFERLANISKKMAIFLQNDTLKIPYVFNKAFVQLIESSTVLKALNKPGKILNPAVKWQNAIALYDNIVPVSSARFSVDELSPQVDFSQKEFPCDHMVYPFSEAIYQRLRSVKEFSSILSNKIHPAIHRYEPVAEWILESMDGYGET